MPDDAIMTISAIHLLKGSLPMAIARFAKAYNLRRTSCRTPLPEIVGPASSRFAATVEEKKGLLAPPGSRLPLGTLRQHR